MKSIPAVLSAFVITAVIGVSMLLIGANALFNPRTTVMANPPAPLVDSAAPAAASGSAVDAQTADMQALIAQYQDREIQYQQRLDEAVQKLNAANQQLQQENGQLEQADQTIQTYENVLAQLQRRGMIRIDQNGQITLGRGTAFQTESDDD